MFIHHRAALLLRGLHFTAFECCSPCCFDFIMDKIKVVILKTIFVACVTATLPPYNSTPIAVGKAIVLNQCNYSIYLHNTPSAGGGYTEVNALVPSGGSYEQHFTSLTNGNGWSIKLSKDDTFQDILQYEYTWKPVKSPATIWYDISKVNGNPWNEHYWISATGRGCSPEQRAYRYPTDDVNGMQSCPSDAHITLTLCNSGSPNPTTQNPAHARVTMTTVAVLGKTATTHTRSQDVAFSGVALTSDRHAFPSALSFTSGSLSQTSTEDQVKAPIFRMEVNLGV